QGEVRFASLVPGLGQLLATRFVKFRWIPPVIVYRPQVSQRSMQSLLVVPLHHPRDDLPSMLSILQFHFFEDLSECPVRPLRDPVLLGAMRRDQVMTQLVLVQHLAKVPRDVTASIIAPHFRDRKSVV